MYLEDLIKYLESRDATKKVKIGFHNPHSYRGSYDCLAFELKENTTIGEMLVCAKSTLGKTFEGYKGGEFVMPGLTEVFLAEYGHTGEELGKLLLEFMCNNGCAELERVK